MSVDLTLVLPCYNEASHIRSSVHEILRVLNSTIYSYEIIFIDDCSSDETPNILSESATAISNVRLVFHKQNLGRGGTVVEGINLARGTYVGFIDIDLEIHPRYIPSMVEALKEGYDVATAYRVYKLGGDLFIWFRHVVSWSYRMLARLTLGLQVRDSETGFKFFVRERILPIVGQTKEKGWFWDTEVMALAGLAGLKICELPCLFIRRPEKRSTVRAIPDSINYLKALIRFKRTLHQRSHAQPHLLAPKDL